MASKSPQCWFLPLINGATSSNYNFVISNSTATGIWSFELQVTDSAGMQVNSSTIAVIVNPTIFASAGPGGFISPIGNIRVNYGDSQTFTIKANIGYSIADVIVNGMPLAMLTRILSTMFKLTETLFWPRLHQRQLHRLHHLPLDTFINTNTNSNSN